MVLRSLAHSWQRLWGSLARAICAKLAHAFRARAVYGFLGKGLSQPSFLLCPACGSYNVGWSLWHAYVCYLVGKPYMILGLHIGDIAYCQLMSPSSRDSLLLGYVLFCLQLALASSNLKTSRPQCSISGLTTVRLLRSMLSIGLSKHWGVLTVQHLCACVPSAVNPLLGRLFACWTIVTCALCLLCAYDPTSKPIYGKLLYPDLMRSCPLSANCHNPLVLVYMQEPHFSPSLWHYCSSSVSCLSSRLSASSVLPVRWLLLVSTKQPLGACLQGHALV